MLRPATAYLFFTTIIFLLWECYINGSTECIAFWDWLFSFSISLWDPYKLCISIVYFFSLLNSILVYACTIAGLFIYPSTDTQIHVMIYWLMDWVVRDLKGTCLEQGDKEVWGRDTWIDHSEWVEKVVIFVSHVSAYQRVASGEENFNNQVKRMNSFADTNQPLFPATSVIAQWAHRQSAYGGRYRGYP